MAILGEFLRQDKQLDAAISILQHAVTLDPASASAWTNFGTALQEAERIEEAKAAYEKALAINPKSAEIASNLGAMAKDAENWEEAAKMFRIATTNMPESALIQCNFGIALNELNEWREAEECLKKSIAINANHAPAWVGLSLIQSAQGNFELAREYLDKALAADPDSLSAWALLPSLRKMTDGDLPWLKKAKQLLETRKASKKDRVLLLYAMGKYCDDTQDYARAFEHYRLANNLKKQINRAYDPQNQAVRMRILIGSHSPDVVHKCWQGASDSMHPLL